MSVISITPPDYSPVTISGQVAQDSLRDIEALEAKLGITLPRKLRITMIEKLITSKLNKCNITQ
ncbi:hypothetical protein 2050HW_00255 [Serratia phage vB_SmaM_ 2050HW]|uniref:Uncharacterized protein n=1 Tax=Serratia phage vB_SmaM_ 2050HW TaxID=2024252 RepID=A0A289ZW53_9CAUD|nr:hypothetical protein HWB23_gp255 [Serratia phage vB_SmaM_ 2050HW]ATA65590.1 hypothetical protein 2050HW_00255 [Serratia phage vB_SmaM_ 2050HW]UCR74846.1 hypothetical protein [Serratia phage BUCT660]URG14104.1 hypothetical protein [Pectobacterium phage vB_ParM-25]